MSSNAFDRNKTKEARLGALITEPGEQNQRDAVHIAVVPVVAAARISPGERVGVVIGDASGTIYARPERATAVGIADPFLDAAVEKGQTFWLFLFQGQVTTLRHEWTHPAFPAVKHVDPESVSKEASEKWLRDFCDKSDCPRYETVLARVLDGDFRSNWDESYFHFDGQDAHADIPAEFWRHMSVVTGKTFESPPTSFSCSC